MICKACGKELPTRKEARGRPKVYCNAACRFAGWTMKPTPGIGKLKERERLIKEYYDSEKWI